MSQTHRNTRLAQAVLARLRRANAPVEFYHATYAYHVPSLKKGIDPRRSGGHGQGHGFYVFLNEDSALGQAANLESGYLDDWKAEPRKRGKSSDTVIVVIDAPLTPENFDVDYEGYGIEFLEFLCRRKDTLNVRFPEWLEHMQEEFLCGDYSAQFYLSIEDAVRLAKFTEYLRARDPKAFADFQRQVFEDMRRQGRGVLKYIGPPGIRPLRIEQDGKVLWRRPGA